jgi:hypothetical protein
VLSVGHAGFAVLVTLASPARSSSATAFQLRASSKRLDIGRRRASSTASSLTSGSRADVKTTGWRAVRIAPCSQLSWDLLGMEPWGGGLTRTLFPSLHPASRSVPLHTIRYISTMTELASRPESNLAIQRRILTAYQDPP